MHSDMLSARAAAPAVSVERLVYASEAAFAGSVYAEMERIRASAMRHNVPQGIHTALLHQSGWFLQWKEGPAGAVQLLMARVAQDPRHRNLRVVHASQGPRLLDGPWSMGIVQSTEDPRAMAGRIQRVGQALGEGRQHSPAVIWRHLSTPCEVAGPQGTEAFQRVLACGAVADEAFELVRWLAQQHGRAVVHRRYAGARDLDVASDLVDFEAAPGDRPVRVIAMARRGLAVPLARAFMPDYSHAVLLLSGDAGRDAQLVDRVLEACQGPGLAPVVAGLATSEAALARAGARVQAQGLPWRPVHAARTGPAAAWAALQPVVCAPAEGGGARQQA